MVNNGWSLSAHSTEQNTFVWLASLRQTSCVLCVQSTGSTQLCSLPSAIFIYRGLYRYMGHCRKPYSHPPPRDGSPAIPYRCIRFRFHRNDPSAPSVVPDLQPGKASTDTSETCTPPDECAPFAASSSGRRDAGIYSQDTLNVATLKWCIYFESFFKSHL